MVGCATATQTLVLYDAEFPATLEPSEDINILKIDEQMVKVYPHKTSGTSYYRLALKPGSHRVVVHLPWFEEGSVFFLDVYVIGGRQYLVKYKIGDRTSPLKREWRVTAWIEDVSSGEVVSTVIKNI